MTFRAAFFFAAALLFAAPVMGQENSLYTVANVHVDASAASSGEALNTAIALPATIGGAWLGAFIYRRLADRGYQRAVMID